MLLIFTLILSGKNYFGNFSHQKPGPFENWKFRKMEKFPKIFVDKIIQPRKKIVTTFGIIYSRFSNLGFQDEYGIES